MCVNSEGYDKTARMRGLPEPSLVAYMISTIISRAGSNIKIRATIFDCGTPWRYFIVFCNPPCFLSKIVFS